MKIFFILATLCVVIPIHLCSPDRTSLEGLKDLVTNKTIYVTNTSNQRVSLTIYCISDNGFEKFSKSKPYKDTDNGVLHLKFPYRCEYANFCIYRELLPEEDVGRPLYCHYFKNTACIRITESDWYELSFTQEYCPITAKY